MSDNGKHVPPDQNKEEIQEALRYLKLKKDPPQFSTEDPPDPTKEEIEAAKGERKPTAGKTVIPITAAIPTRLRQHAAREHRDWKNVLKGWIDQKSKIQWYQDGTYQFLLPPPLVKIVWQTTLQERIKYIKLKHKGISDKDAAVIAIESVNAELDGTAKTVDVIDQSSDIVKEARERKASEEEAEAKKALARYRAEMVGSLDREEAASETDKDDRGPGSRLLGPGNTDY